jgi:hypothetical protein
MIPTAKFIADLHRQVIAHAGRTQEEAVSKVRDSLFFFTSGKITSQVCRLFLWEFTLDITFARY